MPITRSELRQKIRDKLHDWYINQDSINAYLSAAATTGTITNSGQINEGDIIELDEEALQVKAVNSTTLTFNRGYKGTTAAAHTSATVAYVINQFTQREFNDAIKAAFRALFPTISDRYAKDIHTFNNRIQLDALDATTGWSALTDATAASLNTSDRKQGTGSLNLGLTLSANSGGYTKTISSAVDASNMEYLNLWVNVASKKDATGAFNYNPNKFCEIRVGNDSAAYAYTQVRLDEMVDGDWTLLNLNLQDFNSSGTWDRTTTDYLAIYFFDQKTISSGNLKMDEWFFSTYPITTNKLRYRLPKNMFRVNDVRMFSSEDSMDYYTEARYEVDGNYITFSELDGLTHQIQDPWGNSPTWAFNEHMPIQLMGDVAFAAPTADAETILLDDQREEGVVLYAAKSLADGLAADRAQFNKFSTQLNRQGGSVLDWIRISSNLRSDWQEWELKNTQFGKPVDMD